MRTVRLLDDEMTIKAFRTEYGAMKKAALRFVKECFSDDGIKSIKLGDAIWTYWNGEERLWEEGKPSNEDLIEYGDVEVGFEIAIKRKPNSLYDEDDEDLIVYSYFDGASFKDEYDQFDLEIR